MSSKKRVSKKTRKGWKKADISEVEKAQEEEWREERNGKIEDKKDTELFFVDTTAINGKPKLKSFSEKREKARAKTLWIEKALQPLTNTPALMTKSWTKTQKTEKSKALSVDLKKKIKKKENKKSAMIDLWEPKEPTVFDDNEYLQPAKPIEAKRKIPIQLRDTEPKIKKQKVQDQLTGAISYMPRPEDHHKAISDLANVEIKKEKQTKKLNKKISYPSDLRNQPNFAKVMLADDKNQSENEENQNPVKKKKTSDPVWSTKISDKERRKMKRKKKKQSAAKRKKKIVLFEDVNAIAANVEADEKIQEQKTINAKKKKENKPIRIANVKLPSGPEEVFLTDELPKAMRQLKSVVNPFKEHLKQLQKKGLIEPHDPEKKMKRVKRKRVAFMEKPSHKFNSDNIV